MSDLVRAARAISYAQASSAFRRRAGVVVSVQSDYTCTVQVAGNATSISGVRYFAHVSPRPGQQVWLDTDGFDVIAVGVIAGNGGALPFGTWRRNNTASTQSINTGSITSVNFDTVIHDPWTMLAGGAGTDVVVPLAGVYALSANASFASSTAGTFREVLIYSGSTLLVRSRAEQPSGGFPNSAVFLTTSAVRALAKDAVVTMRVQHDTGSALNLGSGSGENVLFLAYLGADA